MYYIGLDVHKKTISYCVKDAAGQVHRGQLGGERQSAARRDGRILLGWQQGHDTKFLLQREWARHGERQAIERNFHFRRSVSCSMNEHPANGAASLMALGAIRLENSMLLHSGAVCPLLSAPILDSLESLNPNVLS